MSLGANQSRVSPTSVFHIIVTTSFDDSTEFEYDDFISIADRAQTMGHDHACTTTSTKVVINNLFGCCIKRASRFVEY
jgi:hypothetical protein